MQKKHQFKILSLDGGGIRGIISCRILEFIEQQTRPACAMFDLITGTSTGGIIALGLSKPDTNQRNAFSASQMLQLYEECGKIIFERRFGKSVTDKLISLLDKTLNKIKTSAFDHAGLESLLKERFGDTRLSQALTEVFITTYEIEKEKPFYFQSRLAKKNPDEDKLMREVARSTSAAPTYFLPKIVEYDQQAQVFVDGGVFANNPSILAYGEAKELWKRRGKLVFEPEVTPDDNDFPFLMVSIGTGLTQTYFSKEQILQWKTQDWIEPLLDDVFIKSVAESTHFAMQHLLPPYTDGTPRYIRLNPIVPKKHADMSDSSPKNIEALKAIADQFIEEKKDLLLQICAYLKY